MLTFQRHTNMAHDDGLYQHLYADYTTTEERETAERDMLYSSLDEERAKRDAAKPPEAAAEEDEDAPAADPDAGLFFCDPSFVAGGASLYRNPFQPPRGAMPAEMVEWNRLGQLEVEGMTTCVLFGPGVPGVPEEPTRLVVQGALKDCWFVGACAVLATRPALVKAIFVSDPDALGTKGFHTLRFFK